MHSLGDSFKLKRLTKENLKLQFVVFFLLWKIWNRRIAISMPYINWLLIAPEILIKDISVAVLLPPLTKLSIPTAR